MPKDRWALVWWNEKALLFVRRGTVPRAWLAAHEYRYYKPRDEQARELARLHGQIPARRLKSEMRWHSLGVR